MLRNCFGEGIGVWKACLVVANGESSNPFKLFQARGENNEIGAVKYVQKGDPDLSLNDIF